MGSITWELIKNASFQVHSASQTLGLCSKPGGFGKQLAGPHPQIPDAAGPGTAL